MARDIPEASRSSQEILGELLAALVREASEALMAQKAMPAALSETANAGPSEPDPDEPLSVSVKRAAHLLGISSRTLYRMERANEIRFTRCLSRTVVSMAEVRRVGEGRPAEVRAEEPPPVLRRPRPKKIKLSPSISTSRKQRRSR